MSYDISLRHTDGTLAQVPRHEEGGTYCVGGATDASLNVTYNYCQDLRRALGTEEGIRWLYGKSGADTLDRLRLAVHTLGTTRDSDYWAATPGNAGYALSILLWWAALHPAAVWEGD